MNDLYAVHNDSGSPLVLTMNGYTFPANLLPAPVLATGGRPILESIGGVGFSGSGSAIAEVYVPHGLGHAPQVIAITPSGGAAGPWGASWGLYQASDTYAFYVAFVMWAGGTFQAGQEYSFYWSAKAILI